MLDWLFYRHQHHWEEVATSAFTHSKMWRSGRTQEVEGERVKLRCITCGDVKFVYSGLPKNV